MQLQAKLSFKDDMQLHAKLSFKDDQNIPSYHIIYIKIQYNTKKKKGKILP